MACASTPRRTGPGATQYLGWIDPAAVQRIEIVRGPSSVQYGSDAIGGAVNVLAQRPEILATGTHASGMLESSARRPT